MQLITELSTRDQISLNDDHLSIVEFYTPNCGACHRFAPVYEELAQENPEIHFYKMDISKKESDVESPSKLWKVYATPTLLIFDKDIAPDSELGRIRGNKPKDVVQALLDQYKG